MRYKISTKYPYKRAFITGGASGIGKALALALAEDGWTIGIADINAEALPAIAKTIQKQGGKPLTFVLDVGNKKQFAQVVQDFLQQTQGIDVLFNNAGVGDGDTFEQYSLENWEWLIQTNLMGTIYGCHLFLPTFKKQKAGHIINISSASAILGVAFMSPYAVGKAGIKSASESLLAELQEFGVDVSVVMPTFVKTNITQFSRGKEMPIIGKYAMQKSQITASWLANAILKQAGKRKFYIIEPFEGKILWFLARFFPTFAMRYMIKRAKKEAKQALNSHS
jgi:short-subunit dehydrogenase